MQSLVDELTHRVPPRRSPHQREEGSCGIPHEPKVVSGAITPEAGVTVMRGRVARSHSGTTCLNSSKKFWTTTSTLPFRHLADDLRPVEDPDEVDSIGVLAADVDELLTVRTHVEVGGESAVQVGRREQELAGRDQKGSIGLHLGGDDRPRRSFPRLGIIEDGPPGIPSGRVAFVR